MPVAAPLAAELDASVSNNNNSYSAMGEEYEHEQMMHSRTLVKNLRGCGTSTWTSQAVDGRLQHGRGGRQSGRPSVSAGGHAAVIRRCVRAPRVHHRGYIAGGLEDAHAIVHGGRPVPTSAADSNVRHLYFNYSLSSIMTIKCSNP